MHLPSQLAHVDPIVASFCGGAVGVLSTLMVVEANNSSEQASNRCIYCGVRPLAAANPRLRDRQTDREREGERQREKGEEECCWKYSSYMLETLLCVCWKEEIAV